MISHFVHVLFFIVTIIVTSNGKRLTYASAKANANFSNIIVNNVSSIHVQLGQGQIQCLQSCLDNVYCVSFFYNLLIRECRHYEVDFTDPEDGVPENGWKYYTVIRGKILYNLHKSNTILLLLVFTLVREREREKRKEKNQKQYI